MDNGSTWRDKPFEAVEELCELLGIEYDCYDLDGCVRKAIKKLQPFFKRVEFAPKKCSIGGKHARKRS